MSSPRAIVVVGLSPLGDVVLGVPVAVALKRAYPEARIGWVVETRVADVLAGHPAVDHLFRLPGGWPRSPRAVLGLRRQLRWFAPDACIDLQGLLTSAAVTRLSGAPLRIGPARTESRAVARLAYTHRVAASADHVVDRGLALLGPLGIDAAEAAFDMPRWPVSRLRVERWLASLRLPRPPVLIHPGAGCPAQRWPAGRFTVLARAVARTDGQPVIVVAGAGDRDAAERVVSESFGAAIAAPPTSLQDLGEFCRLARVFVSGHAGPLHIAAAVGTPCVGLFGAVSASRSGPRGVGHICLEPPADMRPSWSERRTDMAAMAAIDVERVVAATETLLARCRAA